MAQGPWHLFEKYAIVGASRPHSTGEDTMTSPTIEQLDARIAAIRANINDLVEQAAAYSGAGDESRAADRIAQQEQELVRLTKLRDELSGKSGRR